MNIKDLHGQMKREINVLPGEPIQAAIDAAPERAVICLADGEWTEHVTIEKSLTLRGAGSDKTIVKAREAGKPVIRIASLGEIKVRIEGLTSAEAKLGIPVVGIRSTWEAYGILIVGKVNVTMKDCLISRNKLRGIVVRDSAQAMIVGTLISGSEDSGVLVTDSARATIEGSGVERNANGISLCNLAQVSIKNSSVRDNEGIGIRLGESVRVDLTDSLVSANLHGISMSEAAQAMLVGNRIIGNKCFGVALWDRECFNTAVAPGLPDLFQGYVSGRRNEIPGPDEPDGNEKGAICPEALSFLMTDEGGELDRRK